MTNKLDEVGQKLQEGMKNKINHSDHQIEEVT